MVKLDIIIELFETYISTCERRIKEIKNEPCIVDYHLNLIKKYENAISCSKEILNSVKLLEQLDL